MRKIYPAAAALILLGAMAAGPAPAADLQPALELLLSRLDTTRPELAAIEAMSGEVEDRAAALLDYFRRRTDKIPVFSEGIGDHPYFAPGERHRARGKIASAMIMEIADDAVNNILIASHNYPRHDFGPDIDWFTNRSPNQDGQWPSQLHRHVSWTALGRAYWHTGDEKYAEAYARQLADWIRKVTPDRRDHQAWFNLQVGIRGYNWTGQFFYFLHSPHYTAPLLVRQLNSFHDHASLLYREPFAKKNHALMEAEGMVFIGVLFPEFREALQWRRRGIDHLVEQIDVQVLPDGMQFEMGFSYHGGSIRWFWRTLELARLNGLEDAFPPSYQRTIERMYEVLGRAAHPSRNTSMFGDDKYSPVLPQLKRGHELFPDNPTIAFLATEGKQGEPPETSLALTDAGIYSLRSDWSRDAVHFIMKCGIDGGWHSQPDNATFELFAHGRYLMPDSGCFIYHAEGREWFRQTRVHQTLTLDGRDSTYGARMLQWKTGEELDTLVVENRSYPDLRHRRAVLFVRKEYFVLVDEALGPAAGQVALHFQLAPGEVTFLRSGARVHTRYPGGANLLVAAMDQPGMTLEPEEGWVSYQYGKKERRPAFRFGLKKAASLAGVRFVTLLLPYKEQRPDAAVSIVGSPALGAAEVQLEIRIGDRRERVGYHLEESP